MQAFGDKALPVLVIDARSPRTAITRPATSSPGC